MSFDFGMSRPYLKPMKTMGITTSINKVCIILHGGKNNIIPNCICLHWIFYIVCASYPSCLCLQPWPMHIQEYFLKLHYTCWMVINGSNLLNKGQVNDNDKTCCLVVHISHKANCKISTYTTQFKTMNPLIHPPSCVLRTIL
jgi:hypothetical protein